MTPLDAIKPIIVTTSKTIMAVKLKEIILPRVSLLAETDFLVKLSLIGSFNYFTPLETGVTLPL